MHRTQHGLSEENRSQRFSVQVQQFRLTFSRQLQWLGISSR